MSATSKKERVRATLAGEPTDRSPASLWGHDFLREWSPDDLVQATLDAYRPYNWDFIKLNPRATYFAEAWGNNYEPPREQRQPRLTGAAISRLDQFDSVRPLDASAGVFGEHLLALRQLLRALDGEVVVVHTIFSPLTVLAQLAGSDPALLELAPQDRDATHRALAAVTTTLAAYAAAAVRAGAAGIFFAPLAWTSRDTCSDDFYQEFGRPYDLQVLASVADAPFNILHVCRNNNMLDRLLDYPVAVFNWADRGAGNPSLAEIRSRTEKAVMGGIDHTSLHKASPDDVKAQAREVLSGDARRTFLTGGCAIRPDTPVANRSAVAEAAQVVATP